MERFYLTCAPAWYDERGLLKQDAIEEFLSFIKAMYAPWAEAAAALNENDPRVKPRFQIAQDEWNPYRGNGVLDDYEGAMGYAYGEIGFIGAMLRSPVSMIMATGAQDQAGHGGFAPLPGQAQNVYMPSSVIGVNAKSVNVSLAKEFIKTALELNLQKTDTEDGLPVHTGALAHQMAEEEGFTSFGFTTEDNRELHSKWPDEAARARLVSLVSGLSTPTLPDIRIHDILVEESAPFFAGERELEQAAGNIVQKANAYLSE